MTRDLPDDWRLRASCGGMADETYSDEASDPFYTPGSHLGGTQRKPRPNEYAEAKTICARCPVVAECLEDAFATRDYHGYRGGLTGEQRQTMLRKHQRHGAPLPTYLIEQPKPTRKPPATKPNRQKNDWAARELLHKAGATDRQIAEHTGTTQSAIRRWRHRRGYPPNKATA